MADFCFFHGFDDAKCLMSGHECYDMMRASDAFLSLLLLFLPFNDFVWWMWKQRLSCMVFPMMSG